MAAKKKAAKKATKKPARKTAKKTVKIARKRVLAKVGVKANKDELVYYKDGTLYAVKRKIGGTKGARKCTRKK